MPSLRPWEDYSFPGKSFFPAWANSAESPRVSKPREDKRVLENVLLFICFGVLGSWERLHSYKFNIYSIEFLLPGYGICILASETD